MWSKTYSKTFSGVKKEDIWRLWADVNNWADWLGDVDYCKIEGPFKIGNYFMMKPKGMNPIKIVLTEVEEGRTFTDCTSFFGAKMYDTHTLEETPEGIRLTSRLVVTGPLQWLWVKLVAKNVATTVPSEMETLIKLIRQHS
jgi:hypothetical protein